MIEIELTRLVLALPMIKEEKIKIDWDNIRWIHTELLESGKKLTRIKIGYDDSFLVKETEKEIRDLLYKL